MTSAALLWRAAWTWRRKFSPRNHLYSALMSSLCLRGAFLIVDEICIAYAWQGSHLGLFAAHLVTPLVLELLPND